MKGAFAPFFYIMKYTEELGSQIIQIVENQLNSDDPPETRNTLNRLIGSGYDESNAKQLIAQCVLIELFDVVRSGRKFDFVRYVNNLHKLPALPISAFSNETSADIIKKRRS